MKPEDKEQKLINAIKAAGLDGFLVPSVDEYQNEFVPPCFRRLEWLTGFTGSAGSAVLLATGTSGFFTDGRYLLQAANQINTARFDIIDGTKISLSEWLAKRHEHDKLVLGYHTAIHTPHQIEQLKLKLPENIELKPLAVNLIDGLWAGRPALPNTSVVVFSAAYAGQSSVEKRAELGKKLSNANSFIVTMPDSIAWLLNIRAHDVAHNPVALSTGILYEDGRFDWFIDATRVSAEVLAYIGAGVTIRPCDELEAALKALDGKVGLDAQKTSCYFYELLDANKIVLLRDPVVLKRAQKNTSELKAMRQAHELDGVAMVKFTVWLKQQNDLESLNEMNVAEQLQNFRKQAALYVEDSFESICGFAGNGAIIHYRADEKTCRHFANNNLLLLDSGGQYQCGTTDITRVFAFGEVTPQMREHYTRVLKGHIALSRARFPRGTTGAQLDTLARQPLWEAGLDYAHGTGHGVGCFLSVHEEAASISPRGREALLPGMVLSNEPGFYLEGEYGIRIENLIAVEENKQDGMLEFETLTLAPYERKLIDKDLLSSDERAWINAYHQRVRAQLTPHLNEAEAAWLQAETAPL